MQLVTCPICREPLTIKETSYKCSGGHEFTVRDRIVDLMPTITDKTVLREKQHWDGVAEKGFDYVKPDPYINRKIFQKDCTVYEQFIMNEWSDYENKRICLGEIACGSGSAISYLGRLKFSNVSYVGADISIKRMQLSRQVPHNWQVQFVRTSALQPLFKDDSMDIIFAATAFHHISPYDSVIPWISKSLKHNGLLILDDFSDKNPLTVIGRKLFHGYLAEGKKPIYPNEIKEVASKHNLQLVYEKGLHFLTGILQHVIAILKLPKAVAVCAYHISRFIDYFVISPSWNYSFIQIYRKTSNELPL